MKNVFLNKQFNSIYTLSLSVTLYGHSKTSKNMIQFQFDEKISRVLAFKREPRLI